jgi:hypothetical protein
LLGAIGIGLSLFPLFSHFSLLLNLLGISAGAVGSVILTRYLIGGAMTYGLHAICWALGTAVGFLTSLGVITLTGMPVLDAVIVGAAGVGGGALASAGRRLQGA